jgi:hypothetical protein
MTVLFAVFLKILIKELSINEGYSQIFDPLRDQLAASFPLYALGARSKRVWRRGLIGP